MKNYWEGVYRLAQHARPYLPFTALNTVWRSLHKDANSVLDIGCGQGEPARFLKNKRKLFSIGIDIFLPYLREAQKQESHDAYVLGDIRYLPFRPKSFDVVLAVEVLEHLKREEGLALIKAMEQVAKRQVIITTPVCSYKQDPYDGNPYQEHQHIWQPKELRQLGYKVRGHGLRYIGGMSGIQSPLPRLFRPLMDVLWVLAGLFTYFLPTISGDIVGMKKL